MIIIKRGTTVAGSIPNADKAEGRASIDEDLLEVELTQTELRKEMIPKHVAVIMDGNGRWAKMRGLPLSEGHTAGMQSLKTMVKMCLRWEIKVLTIFMFSTDNWIRPKLEVEFLFSLLERIINSETEAIMRSQQILNESEIKDMEYRHPPLDRNRTEPTQMGFSSNTVPRTNKPPEIDDDPANHRSESRAALKGT
ncbi:undecaprenyl pyrophosphate synthase [Medicago truncatula]|uniref:Undecaprenyl pyrophosphate synthase n=1 Tax=Medicago truncatula TaxID=3880 RepID=G7K6E6_MEDTR|nr:undecaprenyl pyrophosphate synthase [Medicago truncatula]